MKLEELLGVLHKGQKVRIVDGTVVNVGTVGQSDFLYKIRNLLERSVIIVQTKGNMLQICIGE